MEKGHHLVQILLPTRTGDSEQVDRGWFEALLVELTMKFGGATSFLRTPGEGLWQVAGEVEQDNIAVVEVMTDELNPAFWSSLRRRLEKDLCQREIVIRAEKIIRL